MPRKGGFEVFLSAIVVRAAKDVAQGSAEAADFMLSEGCRKDVAEFMYNKHVSLESMYGTLTKIVSLGATVSALSDDEIAEILGG